MKVIFFVILSYMFIYAGSISSPTQIVQDTIYTFDKNSSKNYYSFVLTKDANIFIVNENQKEPHSFRIYDNDLNFVKSDTLKQSKTESLYEGRYIYHCTKGSFSLYSNNLKTKDTNTSK